MRHLLPILALAFAVDAKAQSSPEAMSIDNAIQTLSSAAGRRINNGESFVNYHGDREPPKGSRLLFDPWTRGFVIGVYDTVLKDPNLFLNYDKITHNLYLTFDGKTIVKVETGQARELHFVEDGIQTVLTRVDGIDPDVFFQRLSDSAGGSHYVLYRLLKTQFRRADYHTDGLVSYGNNYDEYVDSYEYFIVMPGGREFAPVELKSRSLRQVLGPRAAANCKKKIDEASLVDVVNRLNLDRSAATGNAAYLRPQTSSPSR
ncbi:MAG TPA: hypothetical protein VHE34_21855 [Puia sp.]|uniref:hypothetical protein n=1 Tax=Puia sp. TaxID=2045100 RepID=UPI002BB56E1F|nr:hypothetical protein [Puia sp.]HVU97891.1 hypothetical protein [Puia sp.]